MIADAAALTPMAPMDDPLMAVRRGLLETTVNPGDGHEYVVTLEGSLPTGGITATLRFVPDRQVLSLTAYGAYLDVLGGRAWSSLEAAATIMLADINNEVIPRWVQIGLCAAQDGGNGRHAVVIEDRQPGWQNPALLTRIPAL